MSTYTGLLMAGTPHPNDDGLMYHREPRRLWLSENSRAVWCLDSPALAVGDDRRGQTVLIPKRPSSILDDGLLMIATHVLKVDEVKSALINSLDCDELPARINLAKSVTSEQHRSLIELSRWHSVGHYFKLIITNFSGCSIEQQMPVLEHYGYDVEVLVPTYTRLYSRWLNSTVIRGSLSDLPSIKSEHVVRY